ncbi:MAG: response regulator [Stigonema ocellatum SAG 48.90 = DSM 106950]|nr:response regulator [Stigonema ocellatum SAG 48.90 = DSM 106950]
MLPEQQQRILGYFIEEAKDHLNTIEQGLLNLQSTLNDPEMINEVFRAAHSIKGGAAMLGLSSIQHTSHRLEDCFKILKEHPVQVDQKLESLFLGVSDTLKVLLEHLQEPFGLSEETANDLMSEAEPVFQWLHEHLEVLVKQGGSRGKTTTSQIAPIESDRKQQIQTQVLQILRDMLQLFKQTATPETRQNLQHCCQQLARLGEEFHWSNWCNLCRTTGSAIANPENTYLTLAKISITEIKQGLELVLAGREAEIAISQQLESLILIPEIELLEIDFPDVPTNIAAEPLNTPVPMLFPSIDTENDDETVPPTTHNFTELAAPLEVLEIQPKDSITSLSELSFAVNRDSEDDAVIRFRSTNPNCPEVGIAELNTLADLFEGETPDLDGTWEQVEILDISAANDSEIDLSNSDTDSVFEFLLKENISSHPSQTTTKEEDFTLEQLFGDDFLKEENLEPQDKASVGLVIEFTNEELVAQEDKPTVTHKSKNTQHHLEYESSFDNFFTETTITDLVEEIAPSVHTKSEMIPPQDQILSLDALFTQTEKEQGSALPQGEPTSGYLLDTPSTTVAQFSQQEDDVSSFWKQGEFASVVEEDAAKALEEILHQSVADDIFGDSREPIASTPASLNLEDQDMSFYSEEQQNLILLSEAGNDLFEELASTNSTISSNVDNGEVSEHGSHFNPGNSSTAPPPEALELMPEFTNSPPNTTHVSSPQPSTEIDFDWLHAFEVESDESFPVLLEDIGFIDESLLQTNPQVVDVETSNNFQAVFDFTEITVFDDLGDLLNVVESDLNADNNFINSVEIDASKLKESHELENSTEDLQEHVDAELADLPDLFTEVSTSIVEEVAELEFYELGIASTAELEVVKQNEDAVQSEQVETADDLLIQDEFAELDELLQQKVGLNLITDSLPELEITALEELLESATDQVKPGVSKVDIDDQFKELVEMVKGDLPQRPSVTRTPRFEQLMKVPVKHLDDLSNLVGELVVNRNTLEQDQERMRQSLDNLLTQVHQLSNVGARMQELYERSLLEASLLASRKNYGLHSHPHPDTDRGFSELEMDRFTPFHTLSQEMIELIVRVRESASDIDFVTEETEQVARQFRQVTTQLQEEITRSRMEPFAEVTTPLERGVRESAIKCGKQAQLMIEGRDTLIDKMILEHLKTPLTHLLNNAIAHGIETPEVRQAIGKPPVGVITVRAFHQGNQTIISVQDDGAGIDPEGVKATAIKKGLMTAEQVKTMSRIDVYDLLFQPGFSTKDKEDELAGRGVGLDVVLTRISEIRGTITIDSTLGKGTMFTIRLPLTLSICKALFCVWDKARIAFPMDGVEDTLDVPVKNVQHGPHGQKFIPWRDTALPFRPLKELLTLNRQLSRGSVYGGTRDDDMISVVVVRSANTLVALEIDQVLSEQEIVIKQFEGPAPKPIGVAGATILGDGRIMPIADVLEIIDIFQGRTSKQRGVSLWDPKATPDTIDVKIDPTVLIVDDSITVRELLSLTFNKAGYRVEQARDGQEAWDKLRSGLPCDIVFCDIEMPRCDGLELLSRIQKDPNLNELPIAMLTSRGADKHRQMAIQLGASGYFTKPYLEEALLEAATRMLKGEKLVT